MYRFHRRLSSFCRLIRFDHRGMGMSSRIGADKITPACWAEDVVAVMDAVGSEQATVFASGFTAMSAIFLAADRPHRVSNLVIVNGAARALWAPDYEVGITRECGKSVHHCRGRTRRRGAGIRCAGSPRTVGRGRHRVPHLVGRRGQSRRLAEHGAQIEPGARRERRAGQAAAHHRADPGDASQGYGVRRGRPRPISGRAHRWMPATSNCRGRTRSIGWVTAHRSSTRSKSSSRAPAAARNQNGC